MVGSNKDDEKKRNCYYYHVMYLFQKLSSFMLSDSSHTMHDKPFTKTVSSPKLCQNWRRMQKKSSTYRQPALQCCTALSHPLGFSQCSGSGQRVIGPVRGSGT